MSKSFEFIYNYEQFVREAHELALNAHGAFNICEEPILHTIYLKGMISAAKDAFSIEMHILFSEVYQMPCLYFNIYDNKSFMPITFMQYQRAMRVDSSDSSSVSSNTMEFCVITKDNHPYNGNVCEYMHLCKLSSFLKEIGDVRNVLYFWCSVIFPMFNIDLLHLIPFKTLLNNPNNKV